MFRKLQVGPVQVSTGCGVSATGHRGTRYFKNFLLQKLTKKLPSNFLKQNETLHSLTTRVCLDKSWMKGIVPLQRHFTC
jgi:hypothetical protein